MANNALTTIPWDQTADYLSLTRRVIPPGGVTAYSYPHPVGTSATDVTTFVYGQADIHLDNWPEVMYMLEPNDAWKTFMKTPKPGAKRDHNGCVMKERYPRAGSTPRSLLDFHVLPDSISSCENWWFFDLWRRIDPRIQWDDITMRIEQPNRTKHSDTKLQNSIQTMAGRKWHPKYFMLSWFPKGRSRNAASRNHVFNALAAANIPRHLNTTRGLTPGLVDPAQPQGRLIPHPIMTGIRRRPRVGVRRTRKIDAEESDESDLGVEIEESDEGNVVEESETGEVDDIDAESNNSEGSEEDIRNQDEDKVHELQSAPPPVTNKGRNEVAARLPPSPFTATPSHRRNFQKPQRHPSAAQATQKVYKSKNMHPEESLDADNDAWPNDDHPALAYPQWSEQGQSQMDAPMDQESSSDQTYDHNQQFVHNTFNYYGPTTTYYRYGPPGSNYYGSQALYSNHFFAPTDDPGVIPSWLSDVDHETPPLPPYIDPRAYDGFFFRNQFP